MGLYAFYFQLVGIYAQRLATGPPLNEFEYCLYQKVCGVLERTAAAWADEWDREHPKTED